MTVAGDTCSGACPLVVVDDESFVLSALRRVLRSCGFAVHAFTSPQEALAFVEANDVHVVLSDYRMPGTDGVELLRRVRELRPLAQRVMLTGYADPRSIEEAVNRSEVFRFVTKPWDDHALKLTLRAAADECHTKAENERLARLATQQNEALRELTRNLEEKVEARTRALASLEVQWSRSLDAIEDPIAVLASTGEVKHANRAFHERFGARARDVAAAVLRGDRRLSIDGRSFRARLHEADDDLSVCAFTDVTVDEAVERRLRQQEKMIAIGQLAGGVAHEINSPLAGILSFAQLLSREPGRSASDLEALQMVEKAARRAARIVDSLLRFSRLPPERDQSDVDLAAVADDAFLLLSVQLRDSQIRLASTLRRGELVVRGSSGEIHQILLNLIRNAIQALGRKAGEISISGERRAGEIVLSVSDTGPGIPAEHLDRIFDPFFTTKPEGEGTGLGLSICYRLMESQGGRIEVESEPGRGSTFRLIFPADATTGVAA